MSSESWKIEVVQKGKFGHVQKYIIFEVEYQGKSTPKLQKGEKIVFRVKMGTPIVALQIELMDMYQFSKILIYVDGKIIASPYTAIDHFKMKKITFKSV
jgi:hypothetical protein